MSAPAVLTPVITRFHEFSLVDESSRVPPGKINVARRFSDRVKRNGERFPKEFLHVDNFARNLLAPLQLVNILLSHNKSLMLSVKLISMLKRSKLKEWLCLPLRTRFSRLLQYAIKEF